MSEDQRETIWGLGVGPGDPDLITLKAHRILQSSNFVAYPALAGGESLVRSIAERYLPTDAEEYVISTPMEVQRHPAQDVYDQAAADILAHARDGRKISILCEGDPFFYGSFMYLFSRLSEDWPVGVVPGVSSLAACSAELGLPLAARNDVVSVIPGTLEATDLRNRLLATDVAVIIKVGRHLEKVRGILADLDLLEDASYIERATMENQRIVSLADLGEETAPYFSMIIVRRGGDAVDL